MARIRTFVAIDLSEEIRSRAAALIKTLSQIAPSVRWVEPPNLHVTLQFLGDVPDAEVYRVCQAIRRAASGHAPFQISSSGVGAFPRLDRPRTVWIGLDDEEQHLTRLQHDIEAELYEMGFARETRPYVPHVTIGRVSRPQRNSTELEQALSARADELFGQMEVDECVVYASELRSSGPTYTRMGAAELGS